MAEVLLNLFTDPWAAAAKRIGSRNVTLTEREPITKEWLQHFVLLRGDSCSNDPNNRYKFGSEGVELTEQQANTVDELMGRLVSHSVLFVDQLEEAALDQVLHDILECKGVADGICEYVDSMTAQERHEQPISSFIFSLCGSLSAMESTCVNCALAGALLLSMTFGNYASIGHDDWFRYQQLCLEDNKCKTLAEETCTSNSTAVLTPNLAAWQPVYCLGALLDVEGNPETELTGDRACCAAVIRCASWGTWNMQLVFAMGNGVGSLLLMIVVLFSTWLYMALAATKANTARTNEGKILSSRLKQEFLVLNFMWVAGITFSWMGLLAVMTIKSSTYFFSNFVWSFMLAGAAFSVYLLAKTIYEIFQINKAVDKYRNARIDIDEVRKTMMKIHERKKKSMAEKILNKAKGKASIGSPTKTKARRGQLEEHVVELEENV